MSVYKAWTYGSRPMLAVVDVVASASLIKPLNARVERVALSSLAFILRETVRLSLFFAKLL